MEGGEEKDRGREGKSAYSTLISANQVIVT